MISRFLWLPLSNLSFLYPEFDTTAEAVGTLFWLLVISLAASFILSWMFLRFLDEDEKQPSAIGIEARIKIYWALAYGIMALIVGIYTCILGGVLGLRELGWAGVGRLSPFIVVALLLVLFSRLSIVGIERRT